MTRSSNSKSPEARVADIRAALEAVRSDRDDLCCAAACWHNLRATWVDSQLIDVEMARSGGYRGFWFWVRTLYYNAFKLEKKGTVRVSRRVDNFRLPSVPTPICRKAFCLLLGISERTLQRNCPIPADPLAPMRATPAEHGNHGHEPINKTSSAAEQDAIDFILDVVKAEGIPNPRFAFDRDGDDEEDEVVVTIYQLPPYLSLRCLYRKYDAHHRKIELEAEGVLAKIPPRVGNRKYFFELFRQAEELRNVRLSQRTSGMCEDCKFLRKSLGRLRDDESSEATFNKLRAHLQNAYDLREIYKERVKHSQDSYDVPTKRAGSVVLSFDYAVQLAIPTVWDETQKAYLAKRFGLDVHLFGITNDSARQYNNFIYTEGFSNGSEYVISMLHHYLSTQSGRRANTAKRLVLYADSCSGQNRNKYVHAYLIHRICAGYHEEISFNFLAVGHTKFRYLVHSAFYILCCVVLLLLCMRLQSYEYVLLFLFCASKVRCSVLGVVQACVNLCKTSSSVCVSLWLCVCVCYFCCCLHR
jgi:hypothetical protein